MALASPQLLLVYFVLETLSRAAGLMLWQLSRGVDVPGGSSRVVGLDNERATSSALCRLDFDSLLNILPPATKIESVKVSDIFSRASIVSLITNCGRKKFISFGTSFRFLLFHSLLCFWLILGNLEEKMFLLWIWNDWQVTFRLK